MYILFISYDLKDSMDLGFCNVLRQARVVVPLLRNEVQYQLQVICLQELDHLRKAVRAAIMSSDRMTGTCRNVCLTSI